MALPPRHPLTARRTVRVSDLERERFIVMKEGHCLGDQVLNFCEQREVRPNVSFRSAQLETIQALVCAGLGLSLVPAMAVGRGSRLQPVYRPLQPPRPERKIVVAWPKHHPPGRAAEALLSLIRHRRPGPAARELPRPVKSGSAA